MASSTTIKVRGYHLDLYGHVNNARYLEFLEEARWSLIEDDFDVADMQRRGLMFVVVRIAIDYRRPAGLGDEIRVDSRVDRIGRTSATIRQEMSCPRSGESFAEAEVIFVILDQKSGRPTPLESGWRETLERLR